MLTYEYLCLLIDNNIFLPLYNSSFSFIHLQSDTSTNYIGHAVANKLSSDFGIVINPEKLNIASFVEINNSIHILFVLSLNKSDIKFIDSMRVWSSSKFTLVPVCNKSSTSCIGNFISDTIKNINKHNNILSINNNGVNIVSSIPSSKSLDSHYIDFSQNIVLNKNDHEIVNNIKHILGFDHQQDPVLVNNLAHFEFVKFKDNLNLDLPVKLLSNIQKNYFNISHHTNIILSISDFINLLVENDSISSDLTSVFGIILSKLYSKYHNLDIPKNYDTSYYTDTLTYCCSNDFYPMFNDINDFDYILPIKKLSEYFSGSIPNYFDDLYKKYEHITLSHPVYLYDFDNDIDEIILQYTKCIQNIKLMLLWPVCNIVNLYDTTFYNELSSNGTIHAIKELDVTFKQLCGIIYQVYYDKEVFKFFNVILNKASLCGFPDENNKIFIVLYVPNNPSQLIGSGSPLKTHYREILRDNFGGNDKLKINMFLHISDTLRETIELTQLFFNKNSVKLLQHQNLERLLSIDKFKSISYFMTLKNWIYTNVCTIDQIRFMVFSSFVLFSLGLRNVGDLDLLVHHLPVQSSTKTNDFFAKLFDYFLDGPHHFPFIKDGVSIKGYGGWNIGGSKEYLVDWFEKEWPALYGSKSMDDTILNPSFHYYFFGIKLISVQADIARRSQRSRPASYADLFAIKKFVFNDIIIPKIPSGYWKNHVYINYSESEKKKLIKTIVFYLRSKYNLSYTIDHIKHILY